MGELINAEDAPDSTIFPKKRTPNLLLMNLITLRS
jgi:hypothetical protein